MVQEGRHKDGSGRKAQALSSVLGGVDVARGDWLGWKCEGLVEELELELDA